MDATDDGSGLSVLRLVLELAFVAGILGSLLIEISEAIRTCKRTRQVRGRPS